jgi:mannose-6-phosphate isomerase-like protein (cupin superfamily)
LALAAVLVTGTAAQEGTPSQDLAGVTREPLMRAEIPRLPSDPAIVALARFTFAPGAVFPDLGVPGPSIYRVVTGSITAQLPGEGHELLEFGVQITRATPEPEPSPEHDEILIATLGPGDQIRIPPDAPHELRNESEAETVLLAGAMTPIQPPAGGPPWPPSGVGPDILPDGITMQSLDVGYDVQATIPPSPIMFSLERLTVSPGASLPVRSDRVLSLIVVEEGSVSVSGDREIAVKRGENELVVLATPETEVVLGAGDAALIQPGSAPNPRNAGNEQLVVLDLVLAPLAESAGTPEPGTATP